jgi:two-component system chemotaxis response regulator CheB
VAQHDIVVIGGSLGSTSVLKRVLAALPADLPASVFIATHLSSAGSGYLPGLLQDASALPVGGAVDRQTVEPGRVYVAVPNRHLLVINHEIVLGRGPRENMVRPAIDALFRSAAFAFGPRVIGVQLSGLLNDGVSGLFAIKRRGGIAVVQHPVDAEAPDMPRAALEAVAADHVAAADALGAMISELVYTEAAEPGRAPVELALEVEIAAGEGLGSARLRDIAEPVVHTCPHCAGVLSELKTAGPLRFRCQTGHAFTAEALASAGDDAVREGIRVAMRLMEERLDLVSKMARDSRANGRDAVAELYERRAREYQGYSETLRRAATLSF